MAKSPASQAGEPGSAPGRVTILGAHVPSGRTALAMRLWWVGFPPSPPVFQ